MYSANVVIYLLSIYKEQKPEISEMFRNGSYFSWKITASCYFQPKGQNEEVSISTHQSLHIHSACLSKN